MNKKNNSNNLTHFDVSYCRGSVQRRRRDCQHSVARDSNYDFPRKDYGYCCDCCDGDGDGDVAAVAVVVVVAAVVGVAVAAVVAAAPVVVAAAVGDEIGGGGGATRSAGRSDEPSWRSPRVALLACSRSRGYLGSSPCDSHSSYYFPTAPPLENNKINLSSRSFDSEIESNIFLYLRR